MKKTIALLLAALFSFSLIPAIPAATIVDSGKCGAEGDGGNLRWTLDSDGTLTISGTGDMKQNDATGTSPFDAILSDIRSVIIKPGVSRVGKYAFDYCTNLASISIPDSVTSIGDWAFHKCTGLKSVSIGSGTVSIGECVFYNCEKLETITVDPKNPVFHSAGNCLIETESKTLIAGCKTSVIPADGSVTRIGPNAFEQHTGLISITIPGCVTRIGRAAFEECTGLTSVKIENGVTSIEGYVFYGCTGLKRVTLPGSITTIGWDVFWGCKNLADVAIPAGVTSIGDGAFGECEKLIRLTIPNGVTKIDYLTFSGCTGLKSVTIPKSVTAIGWAAFEKCTDLKDVYYSGTKEEWNAIVVKEENESLLNATIHYNFKPTIETPGDVDGDNTVTASDARLALRGAVGLETYEPGSAEFIAADADKDGALTAGDARLILRAAVGLEQLTA